MSLTPSERDDAPVIEVTIFEDGEATLTTRFDTILEAEAFAEQWTERVPGAHYEIEDMTHDHTAWEAAETETAVEADYPASADAAGQNG